MDDEQQTRPTGGEPLEPRLPATDDDPERESPAGAERATDDMETAPPGVEREGAASEPARAGEEAVPTSREVDAARQEG